MRARRDRVRARLGEAEDEARPGEARPGEAG